MAGELGVSGEQVLNEAAVNSGQVKVTVAFAPSRATATLRRANRRLLKSVELEPTISGNDIVIQLPRIRCKAGDTLCWQAYE